MSRGRSQSLAEPKSNSGLKDAVMRNKALKMADKAQRLRNKMAKVRGGGRRAGGGGDAGARARGRANSSCCLPRATNPTVVQAGEADRVIQTKMPKHLFSGKRPKGTADRR